jgi:hypothetical protein
VAVAFTAVVVVLTVEEAAVAVVALTVEAAAVEQAEAAATTSLP